MAPVLVGAVVVVAVVALTMHFKNKRAQDKRIAEMAATAVANRNKSSWE